MPRPAIHKDAAARQRAYRARKKGDQPAITATSEIGAGTPRDVLEAISRDPKAPASSRVQAARALQEADRAQGGSTKEREWLAMRDALLTIPSEDRLRWLLGEIGKPGRPAVEAEDATEADQPDLGDGDRATHRVAP
jgi:hypothetical protein